MVKKTVQNFSHPVYNYCSQIPKGQVSTYKYIALAIYGSSHYSRMVGKILSQCECGAKLSGSYQFSCKHIHCYRVINSNFCLGGFATGWGEGSRGEIKRKLLAEEGIYFDKQGYLLRKLRSKVIFNDFIHYEK
ncbi:MAG: MGMT family protein [Candidatus Moeniiplasma glomeromycotorum]|nr:MGMT family protein [Candidatus Moeniiplasma glomeromycotorum]MCE8169776.1 MGMT family protein [Candidatus Moeniiplasma glomeromycotorum]